MTQRTAKHKVPTHTPSPATDHVRLAMMQTHLAALWPPAWRESFTTRNSQPLLVVSYPDHLHATPHAKPPWLSSWHRMPQDVDTVVQRTLELSATRDVYYGVNLGHPACTISPSTRLKDADVWVVPGLLGDFDGAWGQHKGEDLHLPESLERLVAFCHQLPMPPSVLVDSGGGVHTYHLFPEPWTLATPEEREAFTTLAARFEATALRLARERYGWRMHGIFTANLNRVLRLPGAINHKYGALVTTLEATGGRYSAADMSAWLDAAPPPKPRPAPTSGGTDGAMAGTLDLVTLATHYGMGLSPKSATEDHGSHPVHGSDTGTNVSINPAGQVWHCFRHSSGGGPLDFLAVCEGVLPCEQAKPGGLRGMAYVQAVTLANHRWHAGIVLDARQARLEAQEAADNALAAGTPRPQPQQPSTPEDPQDERPPVGLGPPVHLHQVPDHLANHPDPRVRRHWRQVYRAVNERKRRYSRDPYAVSVPSPHEGVSHARD
jgi:hypothetical protein